MGGNREGVENRVYLCSVRLKQPFLHEPLTTAILSAEYKTAPLRGRWGEELL